MAKSTIREKAIETLELEAKAVAQLTERIDDDFEAAVPGSRTRTEQGTWGIDIRAGLVRQLLSRGVKNIDVNPHCTIKNEHYFSYRREGKTGRQAGVIWLSHLLGKDQ